MLEDKALLDPTSHKPIMRYLTQLVGVCAYFPRTIVYIHDQYYTHCIYTIHCHYYDYTTTTTTVLLPLVLHILYTPLMLSPLHCCPYTGVPVPHLSTKE